jgi:hypothetical protein
LNTNSKLEQYVEVLRETYMMKTNIPEDMMKRLGVLLCNLIKQTLHQRDVIIIKIQPKLVGSKFKVMTYYFSLN